RGEQDRAEIDFQMAAAGRPRHSLLVDGPAPKSVAGGHGHGDRAARGHRRCFRIARLLAPFGFVALLGLIALAGMIMRNSVILVDQIEQDIRGGSDDWTAIVEATVRRFRPIMLTAAAAVLAMIPLSRSDFFGPQAITIMGGLIGATVLTVFFVPALYAAWFRVRRPASAFCAYPAR